MRDGNAQVSSSMLDVPSRHFRIDYDPRLLEEVVLLTMRNRAEELSFRRERDRLYEIADAGQQETAFRRLHCDWFRHLKFGHPIVQAFEERPLIAAAASRCIVAPAKSHKEEGAELFVSPQEESMDEVARRSVGLQVRPESFLKPEGLLALLRHEFLHIADMLDPSFEYEPSMRHPDAGPTINKTLVQGRYRALWDATIDGRLVLEGKAQASLREYRLLDFAQVFPMLGTHTEKVFAQFFDKPCHTHSELMAYAVDPSRKSSEDSRQRPLALGSLGR